MLRKRVDFLNLFQEIVENLYDRTRVEVIRTPSIRQVGGQVWADLGGFIVFFPKQKQLELFNTQFVVRPLKLVFMLNFSQISEVKWPRLFLKISKVTDHCS